ncbi:MAG: hypothetical protein AAFQ75_04960 [Pseudomonadota bacterium]
MPRDLSDLCEKWSELRERLLVDGKPPSELDEEQQELVLWLVMLTDRISIDFDDEQ